MQGCFDALFVWIPAIVCASVIERMYDWSRFVCRIVCDIEGFSCYWKNVRLKRYWSSFLHRHHRMVSVVIERMYDWSPTEAAQMTPKEGFSCYWKNVRLKQTKRLLIVRLAIEFQLSLKECTIEARSKKDTRLTLNSFSCYWKNVRLKLRNQLIENKRFLTVGFWSVFRKWSICTKSAIIFENLGWLLDCFW